MRTILLTAAFMACALSVQASPIDSYKARLSKHDHYDPSGEKHTSPPAIIRQDRANFYNLGKIDPEDEHDAFFKNKANRIQLEKMLSEHTISEEDYQKIMNGTPLVRIDIHPEHVEVTVEKP